LKVSTAAKPAGTAAAGAMNGQMIGAAETDAYVLLAAWPNTDGKPTKPQTFFVLELDIRDKPVMPANR